MMRGSVLIFLLFQGCSVGPEDSAHDSSGGIDTSPGPIDDSGEGTVGDTAKDTAADTGDGSVDTGRVEGQWGTLSGDCGVLDGEDWAGVEARRLRNQVDFEEQEFDPALLSSGGLEIYEEGNLGGSSLHSEILSFEVLARCEGAQLLKTEAEILYRDEGGKKTDLLVEIDEQIVGVSVTRAYHYPPEEAFTVEEGLSLLEGKLEDVLLSSANAEPEDAWSRAMLHVIAWDETAANAIEAAHEQLGADVRDSTLLVVTVTDGDDEVVY